MSVRSYTKLWIHLIWGTKKHEKSLLNREFRKKVSKHLAISAADKEIFMKINYVNNDHVHTLIDLPTNKTIEEVARLLKGELSSWINKELGVKFHWAIGYAGFSVSESKLDTVERYIKNQEEHHRHKSFAEEYEEFLRSYKIRH